jgi:hypothetical protein
MAKEEFYFTYYTNAVLSDTLHMDRLQKGAYHEFLIQQRIHGRLSLNQIKKFLKTDFDYCWPALEFVLQSHEGKYFISWLDETMPKPPVPGLTPEEIEKAISDFKEIEASPFGPPSSPGVYGVFVHDPRNRNERLIYIGSSKDVRKRVLNSNHIYLRAFRRFQNLYVITKTLDTEDYARIEKVLIKHFRPMFNITYRNG